MREKMTHNQVTLSTSMRYVRKPRWHWVEGFGLMCVGLLFETLNLLRKGRNDDQI